MPFELNMVTALLLFPVGLAILIKAADLLVDGSVAIAEKFGISHLIIGLTVVAMGTSAPEVAASISATLKGSGDMAIGNVYGSNIANLALVGGICAMIRPISVKLTMLRREMPAMLIVALILFPVLYNLHLSLGESLFLLALFVLIISSSVYFALKDAKASPLLDGKIKEQIHQTKPHPKRPIYMSAIFVVIGLVGLKFGADFTVESASFIGARVGLSPAVIGLTIVSVGTSLPELMTSLIAALKGHDDLSIGNLVGSNIFNTLLVVGAAGSIKSFSVNPRFIG
ncbi:MAG: calcium/sodium antiporter, partial [Planctomycetes bacterium]|nr:calcium/sodium antiporter [Planctomycetota bacterium]